jgi:hypothetical protein
LAPSLPALRPRPQAHSLPPPLRALVLAQALVRVRVQALVRVAVPALVRVAAQELVRLRVLEQAQGRAVERGRAAVFSWSETV